MDRSERLVRALAAAHPSERDVAFVVAVLERAERARFRADLLSQALRTLGLATAIASLATLAINYADSAQLLEGAFYAVALLAMVGALRGAKLTPMPAR